MLSTMTTAGWLVLLVFLIALALHLWAAHRFLEKGRRLMEAMECRVELPVAPDSKILPAPLRRYLARALGEYPDSARWARLQQRGEMWMKPRGPPLPFKAEQRIDLQQPGFLWRAEFGQGPWVKFRVLDSYIDGHGLLEGKLLGSIPVALSEGGDTDRGELMRYLAELPWSPAAILHNPHLEWRDIDESTVEVACGQGARRATVRLRFDPDGDLVEAQGHRPCLAGSESIDTPWSGRFYDYRDFGDCRLPARGEVRWHLDELPGELAGTVHGTSPEAGAFTYWLGEIIDFRWQS